jgi:hypothetical protein
MGRQARNILTKDADVIACRYSITSRPSSDIPNMHSCLAQAPNRHYQAWLPTFMLSNVAFTSRVLGRIFERQYFPVFTCLASFILRFNHSLHCMWNILMSLLTVIIIVVLLSRLFQDMCSFVTTFLISESCSRLGGKATMKIDLFWPQ